MDMRPQQILKGHVNMSRQMSICIQEEDDEVSIIKKHPPINVRNDKQEELQKRNQSLELLHQRIKLQQQINNIGKLQKQQ
jgi:hypothetical protein